MKNLILAGSSFLLLFSCNSGIEGEGAATAIKEFKTDGFSEVEAGCNCDITIIPSETNKVIIESHQNLIDNFEVKTSGNQLTIKEKKKVSKYDLLNVNIYVTSGLKEIELNRRAKMKVAGALKSDKLEISANDQSNISQTYLDVKNLELDLSGQSNIHLGGTAINLKVSASDESQTDLSDLQSVEVKFDAEDNSGLKLNVLKELSGQASDNAQVSYTGDPDKNTTEKDRALVTKN